MRLHGSVRAWRLSSASGPRTVSELWRFRDRRGGYVRCETPFEALARDIMSSDDEAAQRALEAAYADDGEEVPTLTDHERQFSWVSEIADAVGWRPAYRYRARLSEHINLKEARAYRTLVRRKAADAKAHGSRHLVLNDSFVVRGSAAKGRSSSHSLNAVTSPVVPDQLVANQTFGSLPVPTKHNPADDPTRDLPVRRRSVIPYPDWLHKLDNGQYAAWDATAHCLARLPTCSFRSAPLANVSDRVAAVASFVLECRRM